MGVVWADDDTRGAMDLSKISLADYYGQSFFKIPNRGLARQSYYDCIDAIRPLFLLPEWDKYVTGFCINWDFFDARSTTVPQDIDYAVRLTYFTTSRDAIPKLAKAFAAKKGLTCRLNNPPDTANASATYGGNELQLRQFLTVSTLIGLDILKEANRLNAFYLLAAFRWQVPGLRSPEQHFTGTFQQQSPFFKTLLDAQKSQLWKDMLHWPNRNQVDWMHLFVNMILASMEWGQFPQYQKQFQAKPAPAASVEEINVHLKALPVNLIDRTALGRELQIPNGWAPLQLP